MARLTNTPIQTLTLDLERRKSYSFRCVVLNNERNPLDLSGCVARFVMKEAEYDGDLYDMTNLIVNSEGAIASPESGEISFSFQAAELDGPPGEYNYSIVLWTQDGFSIVLLKGVLNLHPNTESLSVTRTYTSGTANAAIEVVLRGNDVIEVIANTMPQGVGGSNIVGTGRPDNPATLEAKSLALVASAPVGAVFVSLDGAGAGLWAWRRRTSGWFVIEGGPVAWANLTGIPASFNPSAHNHPVTDIAATGIRSSTTFLSGSGVWATPAAAWENITGKPATFAPAAHTHLTSHLTDTTTTGRALMKALNAGVARSAIGAGTSDLVLGTTAGTAAEGNHTHSQYAPTSHQHLLTDVSELQTALNAKANSSHSHDLSSINGLSSALAAKAAMGHSHVATDITGLQAELDAKSAVGHKHTVADVTGLQADLNAKSPVGHRHTAGYIDSGSATDGHVLTADGAGNATWREPPAGGGGGGVSDHGSLTGLGDDDHTQYALADGSRGAFAASTHGHAISDVTGLQSALNGKQPAGAYALQHHSHLAAHIGSGSAPQGHVLTANGGGLADWEAPPDLSGYAPATHTHTASEVSDSTATGRSVLTAADAAAARTAIGAGTSDLVIGTTSTTAKAGNYTPPSATTSAKGIVELATTAETTTGTDTARAVTPAGVKAVVSAMAPKAEVLGVIHHTTAADSRPAGYGAVYWAGTLEPVNAVDGDIWRQP